MIKYLKAAAIAVPLIVGTVLLGAPSASADLGQCPRNAFCAWTEDGFTGAYAYWYGNYPRWGDYGIHDDADSIFNNAPSSTQVPDNVQTYNDVDYENEGVCVQPGETYDAGMNDNDYDSHMWIHSCN
jgi:hypothetical protein